MAAAAAACIFRVLLRAARKDNAGRTAAALPFPDLSAGLFPLGGGGCGLKAKPYCTLSPQQQQQPSAPPPDMKSYLWKSYNEAKRVTKGEREYQGLGGWMGKEGCPSRRASARARLPSWRGACCTFLQLFVLFQKKTKPKASGFPRCPSRIAEREALPSFSSHFPLWLLFVLGGLQNDFKK